MKKRVTDIGVGGVLCLLATPIVAVGALVTMIALRTWSPLFRQRRIGHEGREIGLPKLRTLPRSTPAYQLKTELEFTELPWAMRFIREMHIDELPQLFLVVTGTLSLVGPRPKMPDDVEPVDEFYGTTRVQVPQGCTGLWQISVHKSDLPDRYPKYDIFYVNHQSLRLDLWILWRTIAHGLHLTKLITLDDVPAWACAHGSIEECKAEARSHVDASRPTAEVHIPLRRRTKQQATQRTNQSVDS